MNQKMIFELKSTFEEANYFIQNNMSREEYFKFHSFKEYKSQSYQIKKLCDYAQLFASVNREIIDDHQDKNSRGKQTKRWKVDDNFVKVTETLEKVKECLQSIYVKPILQVKHKNGINLPDSGQTSLLEEQPMSIFEYFWVQNDVDRHYNDLREFRIKIPDPYVNANMASTLENSVQFS